MDHVIGFATRGISMGIATASEAIAGRKKSKDSSQAVTQDSCQTDASLADANDEEDENDLERLWELDAAGGDLAPTRMSPQTTPLTTPSEDNAADYDFGRLSSTAEPFAFKPLPQPIILPQRRPKDRRRGFIRAYAPSLGECSGIDQDMFMQFLTDFDKNSKSSPIFDVINIACFGVGLVPSVICTAVSISVGTVNRIAQEVQMRNRTNRYMDRINETMFRPRGLYAMIMTYEPDMADQAILQVDTTDPTSISLHKALASNSSTVKKYLSRLRVSSGTIKSDLQMPEPAPLIYPDLDRALLTNAPNNSLTTTTITTTTTDLSVKSASSAVQDYLDRRAQANFQISHPNSALANSYAPQQKQFVNRFADPNHPVNSGSIFGLITGGTFDPIAQGRVQRARARARRNGEPDLTDEEKHNAYMGRQVRGKATGTPSKRLPVVGKLLKKGVLYMIVVNMPSEEDMRVALNGS